LRLSGTELKVDRDVRAAQKHPQNDASTCTDNPTTTDLFGTLPIE